MSFFELTVIQALFWGIFIGLGLMLAAWGIVAARRLQRNEWKACGTLFWQAMTASRATDNRVDYAHKQLIIDACSERRAKLSAKTVREFQADIDTIIGEVMKLRDPALD